MVASEVRDPAQRSAKAAKEIKDLIDDSVGKVNDGSRLVEESGPTLDEIVVSVKQVSAIVSQIANASAEQSAGIELVNKSVMQLDTMTQQNAVLVEEATSAAGVMAEQTPSMQGLMSFFSLHDRSRSVRSSKPEQAVTVNRRAA